MKHRILTMFLLWVCAAFPAAAEPVKQVPYAGAVSVNSVLATVDGEPITLLDVVRESGRAEHELAAVYTGERLKDETQKIRRRILNDLILRKLVLKEYRREPFPIPNQLVESMLDRHAKELGGISREELEKRLRREGVSMDTFRKEVRERIAADIIISRNCDQRVTVSPKDVYDEYRRNSARLTQSEQVDFQ